MIKSSQGVLLCSILIVLLTNQAIQARFLPATTDSGYVYPGTGLGGGGLGLGSGNLGPGPKGNPYHNLLIIFSCSTRRR